MTPTQTIQDIARDIFSGRSIARLRPGSDDVQVINLRDIDRVVGPRDQLEAVTGIDAGAAWRLAVKVGDVVIASRGALRAAVVDEDVAGAVAGPNTVVLRLRDPSAAIAVASYLRHPDVAHWLLRDFAGSTVSGFRLDTFRRLPISLPAAEVLVQLGAMVEAAYRYHAAMLEAADARLNLALDLVAKHLDPREEIR